LAVEGKSPPGREVAKGIPCRSLGLWDESRVRCSGGVGGSYVPETQMHEEREVSNQVLVD